MIDLVIVIVAAVIIVAAAGYIRREKKKGVRCIGCPSGGCADCPGCGAEKQER